MSMTTLVCSCGMTLKAAGATPGRIGKCPRCGSLLRVPDEFVKPLPALPDHAQTPDDPPMPGYGLDPSTQARAAFYNNPALEAPSTRRIKRVMIPADHGPIKPPRELERHFRESLTYPLWSWSSVAILIFLPPLLSMVSAPVTFLFAMFTSGTGFSVPGLVLLIPVSIFGLFVWSYTLIFMSHVLTSSAFGELLPPRSPNFSEDDPIRVLGRWFWALLAGFVIGFVPAVAYWINCGEIDWIDRLMLFNLAVLGSAYAQMALLASLLHDDPLAANPITVIRAIIRVGWNYVGISLLGAGFIVAMGGLFSLFMLANNSVLIIILIWLFWLIFLYGVMVVLRRQGLFCLRNKVVLSWFRDRPTWGR